MDIRLTGDNSPGPVPSPARRRRNDSGQSRERAQWLQSPGGYMWPGFRMAASIEFGLPLFPISAYRTGQAELPHPALGKDTRLRPQKTRRKAIPTREVLTNHNRFP